MRNLILLLLSLFALEICAQVGPIPGYENVIKGESFTYHSPQDDAGEAILVRSESSENYIEWETSIVPSDYSEEFVNFNLMMAIDVNPEDPHSWKLLINNSEIFTISSPNDTIKKNIIINGKQNSIFNFKATRVDKYGDLIGYLNIKVPKGIIEPGKPARIKVIGESCQSRTWFIIYKYKTIPSFNISPENAVFKGENGNERVVKLETVFYREGAIAEIELGSYKTKQTLNYGYNRHFVNFPATESETILPFTISIDGEIMNSGELTLRPIMPMTIYLLHHSHVDIGYTHIQKEVEEKQWSYIEKCIELAEKTQSYPTESQFRWNIEVMWALDSYWAKANPEEKARLKNAIQKGWIELDAFYGNELTGLCSSEELIYLTKSARIIAKECGVELKSAMISDIPGWSWGIIPTLSQSGVKYLSLGTNTFHRIGYTIEEWGDKPFYWQSASGKEKVLTWIHGKGYSSFHTGLGAENIVNKLDEGILLSYMNELRDSEYPYDKVILRYNIGSDNGPPDENISEKVKNWNERYVSPKLIISTTSEAFEIFEKEYGETLPIVTGDFTGYWEDGAPSSANETALNRNSVNTMVQAQTLSSMLNNQIQTEEFNKAWKKILLFDEHTWGSWNSISEPYADFTKQQWKVKRQFAVDGNNIANKILSNTLINRIAEDGPFLEVFNTHSWPVKDIVTISSDILGSYNSIVNADGNTIPSQILDNGNMIFLTSEIPAFSSENYTLIIYSIESDKQKSVLDNILENDNFKFIIDDKSGAIQELIWKHNNTNLVDISTFSGLNQYIYVDGRQPENQKYSEDIEITLLETGPIVTSVLVRQKNAPGCNSITTTYRFYNSIERVDIVNEIDKKEIYTQEGLHFAFPFNIPEGIIKYDLAYSVCEIEKDQIKGSNRNFITIENWIDITNKDYGITWISKDAPIFEAGEILNDPIAKGYIKEILPTQTILSYVMNNYWETNYLAAQPGITTFEYSIYPHTIYDPARNEKLSLQKREPLVLIRKKKDTRPTELLLGLRNKNIIIQSISSGNKKGRYIIRIFNAGLLEETISWETMPTVIYNSDPDGNIIERNNEEIKLSSMELKTIVVDIF